jgi:hypothetical protein
MKPGGLLLLSQHMINGNRLHNLWVEKIMSQNSEKRRFGEALSHIDLDMLDQSDRRKFEKKSPY